MEVWRGWRYYRVDRQPLSAGWRLWFYRIYYDGYHNALHLGPLVLGWGDGIPPSVRNSK
jgi:hypothetical protein